MKNFDWTQFSRKIAAQTEPQTLYNAWAIPSEIEKWFLSDAQYYDASRNQKSKATAIEAGDTYEWQWHLWNVTEKGTITKANGSDHIQFTFAGNCHVDVSIAPYDKGSIVTLSQTNIPTDEESKQNIRLGCDRGWSFYLVNLKSVYEGGLDLRNKDADLQPMLNN